MSRILGAGVAMLLLLGCGQPASRPFVAAQPSPPHTFQGGRNADYALAATLQGAGGARYHLASHAVSDSVWSALWDQAALTPALRTASESLMQALLWKMDILADNIANAETISFKRTRVFIESQATETDDALAEEGSGLPIPSEGAPVAGSRATVRTEIAFDQGSALQASNLDVMIQGDGFFQVRLPDERIGYARAGHFVRNADGSIVLGGAQNLRLVDALVIPESIPTQNVTISSSGEVAGIDDDGQIQILGQLRLARFPNQSGLTRYGASVFLPTDASGLPVAGVPGEDGLGLLIPGHLERSNADFVSELLELKTTRQCFDATLVLLQLAAAGPSAGHTQTE
jgi:flagellar basal-body rod protein FlgG